MTYDEILTEGVLIGLKLDDFDKITFNQFRLLRRKYFENFKIANEMNSRAVYFGIGNAFRKEGTLYQRMWSEDVETTQEDVEQLHQERVELFKEVGVNVD